MRELVLVGLVAVAFGLGGYRGTGELGVFGAANLAVGSLALLVAAVRWLRQASTRPPAGPGRAPLVDSILLVVAIVWGAVLVQRAAEWSEVRFDWTYEGRYELADATVNAVGRLPGRLTVTHYHDAYDPRARRTRLLLAQLEPLGDVVVRSRLLGDAPEEEDAFGIASSNTVVVAVGERWERADRPTEGALFEAISYLGDNERRVVYVTTGAGEGDLGHSGDVGYSGLGAALETEGIELRQIARPGADAVPDDADGVLLIAPERPLHPATLAALEAYLAGGGSLIAMLEPGRETGVEALLARWGLMSPEAVVIDPSGGDPDGLELVAFNYSESPITRGLNRNRRTFFRGARTFRLRKPQREDFLRAAVHSSGDAWTDPDLSLLTRPRVAVPPPGVRADYQPIAVLGRFERDGAKTRIVAFGDSDFADNATLRSLYNLDLAMNSVNWALRREPHIALRPKAASLIQFPVPIQSSLRAFYGVGLLVPELLLLAGGLVWLRRRTA